MGGRGCRDARRRTSKDTLQFTEISYTTHMDSTKDSDRPKLYNIHTTQTSFTRIVCPWAKVPAGRQTGKPGSFWGSHQSFGWWLGVSVGVTAAYQVYLG